MQLFPKTSVNLLLKEKSKTTNSESVQIYESELLSDEALEDNLELSEDLEDLPI